MNPLKWPLAWIAVVALAICVVLVLWALLDPDRAPDIAINVLTEVLGGVVLGALVSIWLTVYFQRQEQARRSERQFQFARRRVEEAAWMLGGLSETIEQSDPSDEGRWWELVKESDETIDYVVDAIENSLDSFPNLSGIIASLDDAKLSFNMWDPNVPDVNIKNYIEVVTTIRRVYRTMLDVAGVDLE